MPRPKKVAELTEAEVTQQAISDLQAQVMNFAAAIAAMNTQRTTPQNQRARSTRAYNDVDSVEDENLFAALRRDQAVHNVNNNASDSEEEANDSRWKRSFKLEFPEFNGSNVPEELLDWIVTVEEILEFTEIPLDHCVPIIAIRFRDRPAAWWSQSKSTRARLGKSKITTWDKLKREMR